MNEVERWAEREMVPSESDVSETPSLTPVPIASIRPEPVLHRDWRWGIVLALVLLTLIAYWPVRDNDFINFDDNKYVTENPNVTGGLTPGNIAWALVTGHAANWHPLTWISHQIDVELYGLNARGHHFTNLLLHCANTLLLFLVLFRMTGAQWRSALVAALFALHPLHVESVAWVSERKDVLSTFFFLWTLWAYAVYVERDDTPSFFAVMGVYILGLLSKPMLVSVPLVLLWLDVWPLGRVRSVRDLWAMALEKLPLALLAMASCAVTIYVQGQGEAIRGVSTHPISLRLANAAVSCVQYLRKMVLPNDLAIFYPYRFDLSAVEIGIAVTFLLALTGIVWLLRYRATFALTGWLWYIVTLLPVIGLVQVGQQALADRYTYIPLIGIFVAVAWSLGAMVERFRWSRWPIALACTVVTVACVYRTNVEVRYWKSSITLFERATQVTENNSLAYYNKGTQELSDGKLEDAEKSYLEAIRIKPDYINAHLNLGISRMRRGLNAEAEEPFREILRLRPDHADAHLNLGTVLYRQERYAEAAEAYRELLRVDPDRASGHYSLGLALQQLGQREGAQAEYEQALKLKPDYSEPERALEQLRNEESATSAASS